MKFYENWKFRDILFCFALILTLSFVVLSLDTWILTGLELPFLPIFDLIGIFFVYLFFLRKHRVKFSQIYNVNLIFFIPLFLIVQFFFLALRIVASNGFGDLFLLLKNIYVIDIYDITSLDNISGMLLSPIWEEFLFRGVIFFILFRRFGLKFALFAPAILFAIFHIDPNFKQNFIGTTIISTALLIFFESVTKSLIVYKTKSLTIPTIMHIFGNFLSTIIFAIYDKLL